MEKSRATLGQRRSDRANKRSEARQESGGSQGRRKHKGDAWLAAGVKGRAKWSRANDNELVEAAIRYKGTGRVEHFGKMI